MRHGTWFALVQRTRALSLKQLASTLADIPDLEVTAGPKVVTVVVHDGQTGNDATFTIGFADAPHVRDEAAELVDRADVGGRAAALRTVDARYELTWDLAQSDETYNAMALVAERLERACGATIYDVTGRRFV